MRNSQNVRDVLIFEIYARSYRFSDRQFVNGWFHALKRCIKDIFAQSGQKVDSIYMQTDISTFNDKCCRKYIRMTADMDLCVFDGGGSGAR